MTRLAPAAFACSIQFLEPRRLLAAGDFDAAFSGDGKAQLTFPGISFNVADTALTPSGKTILAGNRAGNVAVARLNVDGTLDTTFGSGGLFESSLQFAVRAVDVETNADEKVVLALGSTDDESDSDMRAGRLALNGQGWDTSFDTDGIATVGDRYAFSNAVDVVATRDGKVVVAGDALIGFFLGGDSVVVRYNANGTLDTTFGGGDGIAENGWGADEDQVDAIAIDYHGTPVTNPYYGSLAVSGGKGFGDDRDKFVVMRLTSNGFPDNGFDGDGILTSPDLSSAPIEFATSVTTMPGGKTVVAGYAGNSDPNARNFLVACYNANGTLDGSFGSGGVFELDLEASKDIAWAVTTGYNGGLLVAGEKNGALAILALTRSGQLDTRFSGDGILASGTPFTARGLDVTGSDIAPVRKLVVAGGAGHVARLVDVGSAINFTNVSSEMKESPAQSATFLVTRTDALDVAEIIFIGTSGTMTVRGTNRDFDATNMVFGNGVTTTTNVVIPAGATSVLVTFTPINDSLIEGDEFLTLTVGSTLTYDAGTSKSALFVMRDNDLAAAPAVLSSVFDFNASLPEVRFTFNQDVGASIGEADFQIIGPAGVPSRTFSYNSITNTATLRFGGALPDGDFVARAISAGITNAFGQAMAADSYLNFFALAGDANRDRTVNFSDLLALARNYNQTGRTFSQGNFDYSADGLVGFNDLLILAKRYGSSIWSVESAGRGDLPMTPKSRRRDDVLVVTDAKNGLGG